MIQNGNYITKANNDGLSIAQVARCLGRSTQDLGQLCGDVNGNGERVNRTKAMAKYKPQRISNVYDALTDTQRANNGWGIDIPTITGTPTYAGAMASSFKAAYQPPIGGYNYRLLDFDGYYHGAPSVGMTCAQNVALIHNDLDQYSQVIPFYAFFKNLSSYVNNKEFSVTDGIGMATLVPTSPSYALNACLGIEDKIANIGNGHYSFGVLLFKRDTNNTLQGFYPCPDVIDDYGVRNKDMFQLPVYGTDGIIDPNRVAPVGLQGEETPSYGSNGVAVDNPSTGTYDAVPVLYDDQNGVYYSMFRDGRYGAPFTFTIGGQNLYAYNIKGVTDTNTSVTTIPTPLYTDKFQVYVTVWIRNDSYNRVTHVPVGNLGKFKLHTTISGTVTGYFDGGTSPSTQTISKTVDGSMVAPTIAFDIPLSTSSHYALRFQVGDLWTPSGHSAPSLIDSGSVQLVCKLYYDGVEIGSGSTTQPVIQVTYRD